MEQLQQESKMYYRDEDKSKKGLQESPFFTADEGTLDWIHHLRALKHIKVCPGTNQRLSLSKRFPLQLVCQSQLCEIGSNQASLWEGESSGRQKKSPSGNNQYSSCLPTTWVPDFHCSQTPQSDTSIISVNFTLNHLKICTYIPLIRLNIFGVLSRRFACKTW